MSRNRAVAAIVMLGALGALAALALGVTADGSGDARLPAIQRDTAALRAAVRASSTG